MNRTRLLIGVGVLCAELVITPVHAQDEQSFTIRENVKVRMSDGVRLAADVYIPNSGKKFPAVLLRTPYDKRASAFFAKPLASKGFAVVVQDVRGQQASRGDFHPIVSEKKDGLDTLDWIAKQRWCDGNIGMWGSSYVGYCALILAPEKHPNLKAIFNISGWGDSSAMVAPGGAMHLMCALPWALSNQIHGSGGFHKYDWPSVFKKTPVSEIPQSMGIDSPQWRSMTKNWGSDLLKEHATIAGKYDRISIPIFHLTGWNDFVGRHTLDVYEGMDKVQRSDGKRPTQRLIVGPWRHDQFWGKETAVGDENYGRQSIMGHERIIELADQWFDRWLRGNENGITDGKPVKLFVMGSNRWREFDQWPPSGVELQKWFIGGGGNANGASGDGTLSIDRPGDNGSDRFVFDPMDPVPTVGGANFHFFLKNLGPKDQRPVEQRDDVLVYTSDPLEKDTEIIGPLKAVIYAATEGKTTDFTAKIVEVRPNGYARIIEDGIKRNPDRIGGKKVSVMEKGKAYRFTIDLGTTAIRIKKGHRLRVEVSSSNFPKYTRNPNTGEIAEFATEFHKVGQTILHSPEYPSHIVLPVMK